MAKTSGQIERERRLKRSQIVINDLTTCYFCKSVGLKEHDKFCPNCRFPQRGSQIEMKRFLGDVSKKKDLLADQQKAVRRARNILYFLGGFNLLFAFTAFFPDQFDVATSIGGLIGAAIYFGLGVWSKRKPFAAILSGFFIFTVFIVMNAIVDAHTIYQGILWKVLIIGGFIYGYKGVKESEKLEEELVSLKAARDLSDADAVQ